MNTKVQLFYHTKIKKEIKKNRLAGNRESITKSQITKSQNRQIPVRMGNLTGNIFNNLSVLF